MPPLLSRPRQSAWTIFFAIFLALDLSTLACRAENLISPLTQSFVQDATISNQFNISASRLAIRNSHNDAIRNFAQQMIVAHSDIAAKMKKAVGEGRNTLLDNLPGVDAKHQKLLDQLSDMKDAAFDTQYLSDQLALQKATLSLFHYYATRGDNESLKDFAKNTLPDLKQHLNELRGLRP